MKRVIALALCAMLSGCSLVSHLPPNSCEVWSETTTVGPFYHDSVTVTNFSKEPNGDIKVQNYTGVIQVMGFTVRSDSFHDLTITHK